jgi:hypothetical protein
MMRKLRARAAAVSPRFWGWVASVAGIACYLVARALWGYPWSLTPWHPRGVAGGVAAFTVGAAHGLVIHFIAVHVERVQQLKLDLAADAAAMRGEIRRLERGER